MSDSNAHFRVSVVDGVVEFSGPREFVEEQIDRWEPLVQDVIERARSAPTPRREAEASPPSGSEPSPRPDSVTQAYRRVFGRRGDHVVITTGIPGDGDAPQTRNVALLLGLAAQFEDESEGKVPADRIRDECRRHNCYDSGNFKATLENARKHFIIEGKGQKYTLNLTHDGSEAAEQLADELNSRE